MPAVITSQTTLRQGSETDQLVVFPEYELWGLRTVSDHASQVHGDSLLYVDVRGSQDLRHRLGHCQVDTMAEHGCGGDLTLVQTGVRSLGDR